MTANSYAPDRVELYALKGLPLIAAGQDLAELIASALEANQLALADGDLLVVAQKIVSKAEGRVVCLADVDPGPEAKRIAAKTDKDPALVQLILDESVEIVRQQRELIIVEHRLGFVMANAGIDQSNSLAGQVILLPENPDASAARLAQGLGEIYGCRIGVIVSDSIGRAWRNGTIGHALGVAGFSPLIDLRQTEDMFGRPMQVSEVGIADEIAAAASALMGQGSEAKPAVIVRGFRLEHDPEASIRSLLRDKSMDLFR